MYMDFCIAIACGAVWDGGGGGGQKETERDTGMDDCM